MLKTLFMPKGELRPYEFLKGCLALFLIQCSIFLIVILGLRHLHEPSSFWVWLVASVALIYPYYCLYGKRLDELKLSRLWFLAIIGFYVLTLLPMHFLGATAMNKLIVILVNQDLLESFGFVGFVLFALLPMVFVMHFVTIVFGLILGLWKGPNLRISNLSTS